MNQKNKKKSLMKAQNGMVKTKMSKIPTGFEISIADAGRC